VKTPPTIAEVVVTKWYHGRLFSATMIWMGDRSYENCAPPRVHTQRPASWPLSCTRKSRQNPGASPCPALRIVRVFPAVKGGANAAEACNKWSGYR